MQVDAPAVNPADFTEAEKAAIEEQIDRLLQNPYFSHSRRFPMFLRFVVGHTLAGQADAVKERTLGIEIFGRNPDYDTSSDPIVRVTAAEIRKRIAQYYQEPGHDGEIRISLPAGSYVPQFHWPNVAQVSAAAGGAEPESLTVVQVHPEIVASPRETLRSRRQCLNGRCYLAAGGSASPWEAHCGGARCSVLRSTCSGSPS